MSGIVAGAATGIARAYIDLWFIVAGIMFAICVVNPNLRFSWLQKTVAVVMMFVITFHGHLLLDLIGNATKLK